MIKRRKDYQKASPHRNASKIYVICEGSVSEVQYFNFFEGLSSNLKIIPISPVNNATDPLKLLKQTEEMFYGNEGKYSLDYSLRDQVWFAIDTDTWEKEDKIEPLRKFCLEKNQKLTKDFDEIKPYNAWQVAQCNPSFEIWLYYHLYDNIPDEEDVTERDTFKKFVNEKFPGGFNFQTHPVWLEDAIYNAEKNFNCDENGKITLFSTEKYLLGKEIIPYVKRELDKLKNKLQ